MSKEERESDRWVRNLTVKRRTRRKRIRRKRERCQSGLSPYPTLPRGSAVIDVEVIVQGHLVDRVSCGRGAAAVDERQAEQRTTRTRHCYGHSFRHIFRTLYICALHSPDAGQSELRSEQVMTTTKQNRRRQRWRCSPSNKSSAIVLRVSSWDDCYGVGS